MKKGGGLMFQRIRSKLVNRITFIISIVLIMVMGTVGVISYRNTSQMAINRLTQETKLKAESISKDVQNIFENANIVTDQMAFHNEIQQYLKTTDSKEKITNSKYFESVYATLVNIEQSSETHFLVWVANEKANFYLDSFGNISGDDYDVKKRPWYKVGMNAEGTVFTPPYVEWITRRVVISSIRALRENNEVYGFVVVDIVLEDIPNIFDENRLFEGDHSFLITGDGTYVYHEEAQKVLNSKYTDKEDPLSEYSEVIEGLSGELVSIEYKDSPYFLTSYPVNDLGWKVVNLIDKTRINEKILEITNEVSTIFFLGIIIAMLMVYYLVKSSTKPYRVLVDHGKNIEDGNLSDNIPMEYLIRTDEMGDLSRSFQVIIDTFRTENDTLEQKIKEKNNELEAQYQHILESEKAASLGNLVAGIAHEINTPIGNSLSTSTYLERVSIELRDKYNSGNLTKNDFLGHMEIQMESLDILIKSLERAAAMISSFKQVAVDQSSELKYPFDLRENFEGIILSLRHEYKRSKHQVINACDLGIEIDSYPGAFGQILTNLIMNSLKHGFCNKEAGIIKISAEKSIDSLTITYIDDGVGMTQEVQANMYDPFFTTNRTSGCSGLGMHIVYNIVTQKLKGNIKCESQLENGVRFIIKIPLQTE